MNLTLAGKSSHLIGYGFIAIIIGVSSIALIYITSIVLLLNGLALDLPVVYQYQKSYYYQDLQRIWQYYPSCAVSDPHLIYAPKLGTCIFNNPEFKTTLFFDAYGRRVPARITANQDTKGIAVLGDSHAMGWGVNDDETFANVLQKMTDKPVFNLGVSSYGTERELKRFSLSGLSEKVDTIIIQYCDNDHGENLTDPKNVYSQNQVLGFKEVLDTGEAQRKAIPKRQIIKKHIYRAFHEPIVWIADLISPSPLKRQLDFEVNNAQLAKVLQRYDSILKNKKVFIFCINGHGEKFSNFPNCRHKGSENPIYIGPPLDKKDFYLHDDHLTAQGHKKLGQWLAQAINLRGGNLDFGKRSRDQRNFSSTPKPQSIGSLQRSIQSKAHVDQLTSQYY
jgi:lysophospholipase L1-like esterase